MADALSIRLAGSAVVAVGLLATPSMLFAGADDGAKTEKRVTFVGFSTDETKAAWHIQIDHHGPAKIHDRFTLYRLVSTESGAVLGSYRIGRIQRLDSHDRPTHTKMAKLIATNPLWNQAAPEHDWHALEKQHGFDAARLSAATTLSIRPDPDVELTFGVGKEGEMDVSAAGNILGYVLTLTAGKGVILGRYRHVARVGQTVAAKVEVLTSVQGNFAAVVNRFEIGGTSGAELSTLTYGKIVPTTTMGRARPGDAVYVRTMWGWQKMTSEQERMWRQSHEERVNFAKRLNALGAGRY